MTKEIAIDFYKIIMPPGSQQSFEKILLQVGKSPDDEKRVARVIDDPIRLVSSSAITTQHVEGDIIRIKMEGVPIKAKLSGPTKELDLDNDEGLGLETAFLYDSNLRILTIQRNRNGVSAAALAAYVEAKGHISTGMISVQEVIRKDVLQKLEDMQVVRTLNIRLAGIENWTTLEDKRHGVEDMIKLGKEFGAPNIEIRYTLGHKKGALIGNAVKAAAQWFRDLHHKQGRKDVEKVEISGKDKDGSAEHLDILDFRMIERSDVELKKRRLLYPDRRNAVRRAYNKRKDELTSLFKKA